MTGTITGTVKDAQGGVIPGATVTLISDTRGTMSAPVVTNTDGDFVVPNIAADTYTIQVEMPSFRTLRRTGIAVSSGSIVGLGTITIDVGGTAEVVTVTAETPLVQTASGERSFTVTTESVANLPLNGRTFEQLLVACARRRRDARRAESGGARRRRWRRQLHARWRDGDGPGHQPPGHAHQRRIAGGSADW